MFSIKTIITRITAITCIAGLLMVVNLPLFSAFEAHVINVTAEICKDMGRTATIGYWKNHPEDYMPHLPMYLNLELVTNESEANFILNYGYDANNMMNKLKGQLLAMKFGVVHFGVGDYFLEKEEDVFVGILENLENAGEDTQGILDYFETGDGKTFNEIVADAEDMLAMGPVPDDEELEAMKNLIDGINNLHEIRYCASPPPEIILNEFLPNPCGDDGAEMPDGEWVELYNNSDFDIDVAGWYLYDSYDSHSLEITLLNSDNNGDTADGGETVVPTKGWLVVYLNGEYSGWLNNTGGDSVRLYDGEIGTGMLVSSYIYTSGAPPGKSFARIPDGIGEWVDPVPTPGAPNILEDYPVVSGGSAPDVIINSPAELSVEEPPVEEPVSEDPLAEDPPVEEPVSEEPPVEELATEPPIEEIPVEEEPPVEDPVPEDPPVVEEEPSVEEDPPTEEPPVEEPPAEEPPVEEPSVEEDPPTEEPPVEDPPTEEPPVEDPVPEDPPVENPPVEEPPAEEPPVEEPPVEEDPPTEELPVEEPPAEEPAE